MKGYKKDRTTKAPHAHRLLWLMAVLLASLTTAGAQTQRWWGNYTDDAQPASMGTESAETYTCGMQLNPTRTILNGATIHAVRFFLRDKSTVSNVKVWLSANRPATADQASICVIPVEQGQLVDLDHDQQMVEVALPTPYSLGTTSIYVGFSFQVASADSEAARHPVVCGGYGTGASGSFFLRTSKSIPSWNDLAMLYGTLAIQLQLSNPTLPSYSVRPTSLERLVSQNDTDAEVQVPVASQGFDIVRDIDYEVTIGGQPQGERHYTLPKALWTPGSAATIPVSLRVPAATGSHDYSVRLTKVNGHANEEPSAQMASQLVAASQLAVRRSVVEEYTGTWCTNCPRGIVGMENLQRLFGDRFVGIAVHTPGNPTDPMVLSDYTTLMPDGVPRCQMDRRRWCDPYLGSNTSDYHFHAHDDFAEMLEKPSEADINVWAAWADEAQTQLSYQVATTFYLDSPTADYALAFVLTEDGLHGNGRGWAQVNGDSGSNLFPDADMDRFRNAPDPVTDIEYQHVAVASTGVVTGIEGSIAAPIADGEAQTYVGTYDASKNSIIQDKGRLTANVLLLSKSTGQVVNAAHATVAPFGTNGIAYPAMTNQREAQDGPAWLPDGRRVERPTRPGLYIRNHRKFIIH